MNENLIGKGKEYYYNGNLLYEGEYLNGERNWKGKGYDCENHLIFEGEYLNGKEWNGKGFDYDSFGNIYQKIYIIMGKKYL